MKKLLVLLVFLGAIAAYAVDLDKPIETLVLPDGRVLKRAQFTAFRSLDVSIKHAGGMIALRYEYLPAELRAAAEQRRPGGPRALPGEALKKEDAREIKGQVFITTQGAGSYKFSDVTVYAFPISAQTAWDSRVDPVELPRPLSKATTDADGRFLLKVPKDTPFLIFAQASRLMTQGYSETHEWHVPSSEIKDFDQVNLGSGDWQFLRRPVKIDEQP